MTRYIFPIVCLLLICSCSEKDNPREKDKEDEIVVEGYEIFNKSEATIGEMIEDIKYVEHKNEIIVEELFNIIEKKGIIINWNQNNVYYDYIYPSSGPDGSPMNYSARLYIPKQAFEGDTLKGLMLMNHHFVTNNNLCPTNTHSLESLATNFGYALILPDGYGLGKNSGPFPILYDGLFNGENYANALLNGIELLDDLHIPYDKKNLINFGYSLGGGDALGTLKYVSLHPETGIFFRKNFVGGALTDVQKSLKLFLTGDWSTAKSYIIITLVSILENNPDIDPKDVFKEPFLSDYKDLISSKSLRIDHIKKYMNTLEIDDMLTDKMMDLTSTINKKIQSIVQYKRIAGGWSLPSGSKLYMFHCIDDDYVPYDNFTLLKAYLENKSNSEDLNFYSDYFLSHVIGMAAFILYTSRNIN